MRSRCPATWSRRTRAKALTASSTSPWRDEPGPVIPKLSTLSWRSYAPWMRTVLVLALLVGCAKHKDDYPIGPGGPGPGGMGGPDAAIDAVLGDGGAVIAARVCLTVDL